MLLLGGVAGAAGAAVIARAQQAQGRIARVGYLDASGLPRWFEAFRDGLAELGYGEGRNLVIHHRWTAGRSERLPELAAELVRLAPDVIVASGSRPSLAAKQATATIPIVAAFATDPVGIGLVASLARPGGNVTGLSNMGAGLMGKRLELLRDIVPRLARVGAIWAPAVSREFELDFRELQTAAKTLNLGFEAFEVIRAGDYDVAFRDAAARVDGVVVLSGPLAFANREIITAAAARHAVKAIYYDAEYAVSGGLASYGPSLIGLHRRAAFFVDRILRGANPAELPVEQPTRFELVVNLRTAQAFGLRIPDTVLARSDQVIE